MTDGLLEKAQLLIQQQRYNDAQKILGELLRVEPDNDYVLYLLSEVQLQKNNFVKADELINSAIALNPDQSHYFFVKARIAMMQDKFGEAEKHIGKAIALDPHEAAYFAIWAQIKLVRKQYDEALDLADQALALDPANLNALNLRSTALLKLNRKEESYETIREALHEDPDNAHTHANHGWGLLERGDHKNALTHFKESLMRDPNSGYAQAGMVEALKAKFIVYRWFLQYAFWSSNMTAKYQWILILGFYFGTRALRSIAGKNEALQPFLYPLVAILALLAFSTWIMAPLSNLYLLLNPFGKYLLNREQKITARLTGICLLVSVISAIMYLVTHNLGFVTLGLFSLTMMIPVSHLFTKPAGVFITYNSLMFLFGIVAVAQAFVTGVTISGIAFIYVIGFVAFQFIANYFVTRGYR